MEGKKLRSLLRFYKKRDVDVELKIRLKEGLIVKGKIIKLSCIFRKYLVIQSQNNAQIKIFFEDILEDSIIPTDFVEEPGVKIEKHKLNKINRSPISPKLRFDVFRRDKFVCQYCGACGPDVELEVDHIIPVSRGGTDEMSNLKTACFNCNRGKGDIVK